MSELKTHELVTACPECENNTFNVVSLFENGFEENATKHEVRCVVCQKVILEVLT